MTKLVANSPYHEEDRITLTPKGMAYLTDTQKAEIWANRKPARFERNCALWPMCMCQRECEAAKK